MVIVFIQQLIEKFLIGCRTYIFANDIYIIISSICWIFIL